MPAITIEQRQAMLVQLYDVYLLQQAAGVVVETQPTMDAAQKVIRNLPLVGDPPVPPPPSGDVLARFNAAPSQWAKWTFLVPEEQWALLQKYNNNAVHRHINWWDGDGYSLQGQHNPDGSYWYYVPNLPPPGGDPAGYYGSHLEADTGGAADAYVAKLLADAGRTMIEPLG